jgi:hypothetical protein
LLQQQYICCTSGTRAAERLERQERGEGQQLQQL